MGPIWFTQMYRIRRILIQLVPQEPLETVSDNHFKKYSVISIRLHSIDHIVSKNNVFLWISLRHGLGAGYINIYGTYMIYANV